MAVTGGVSVRAVQVALGNDPVATAINHDRKINHSSENITTIRCLDLIVCIQTLSIKLNIHLGPQSSSRLTVKSNLYSSKHSFLPKLVFTK